MENSNSGSKRIYMAIIAVLLLINGIAGYLLFNENKENAESLIDKPYKTTKGWNKEMYCVAYTYNQTGKDTKKKVFNSTDFGCKFQLNSNYYNPVTHKLYSISERGMSILKCD